jgi:hypothetical protein
MLIRVGIGNFVTFDISPQTHKNPRRKSGRGAIKIHN